MAERHSIPDIEAIIKGCEPTIKGIIRGKLRVTLDPSDGRSENQDALELYDDVQVILVKEFNKLSASSDQERINDLRNYLAVATYNVCHDYLRGKYPRRNSPN